MQSRGGLSGLQTDFLNAFFTMSDAFFLTGGAALVGYYGMARKTNDLDLFSTSPDALDHIQGAVAGTASHVGATHCDIISDDCSRDVERSTKRAHCFSKLHPHYPRIATSRPCWPNWATMTTTLLPLDPWPSW